MTDPSEKTSPPQESPLEVPIATIRGCGVVRRLVASSIDFLIFDVMVFFSPGWSSWVQSMTTQIILQNLLFYIPAIVIIIYNPLLEGSPLKATIGKLCMGIQVVNQDHKPIGILHAMVRFLVKISLSILTVGLNLAPIVFKQNKHSLHDSLSKTYVVPLKGP